MRIVKRMIKDLLISVISEMMKGPKIVCGGVRRRVITNTCSYLPKLGYPAEKRQDFIWVIPSNRSRTRE